LGVRANTPLGEVLVGNQKLLGQSEIAIRENEQRIIQEMQSKGKTLVLTAIGGQLAGLIALEDRLRPEACRTIQALKKAGIGETIMLTGDNRLAAQNIAEQAGLSGFHAELLPEDKLALIKKFSEKHQRVVMVGDGINDAPALANASVGIAMGGAGNQAALESADIALMGNDLAKLPFAIGLGRATRRVIIQNLVIALGVIAGLSFSALSGWVGVGLAVALHEGSTLVVVLNALRLLGYKQS
jgi:Cd2+/Zn2+-exporting ATPase